MLPPLLDRAERSTQGGDSRWMLTQAGPAPVSVQTNDTTSVQTLSGRQSGIADLMNLQSGSSGLEVEADENFEDEQVDADGMIGKDNEGVIVDLRPPSGSSPPLQSTFGLSPTQTQCVLGAVAEVAAEWNFDERIIEAWDRHLRVLPEDTAVRKKWGSGYWHRWYDSLDLSKINDEIQIFEAVLEDEFHGEDDGLNWIAKIEPSESGDEPTIPDASESGLGSPPITEDDRRVEPALPDLHTQGGSTSRNSRKRNR